MIIKTKGEKGNEFSKNDPRTLELYETKVRVFVVTKTV